VLFEIVSRALRDARPHPEERACRRSVANSKPRARVSKDEDEPVRAPSCFETHRSGLGLWKQLRSLGAAMPLSMRATVRGVFWRKEADRHLTKRSEADDACSIQGEDQPGAVRNHRRFGFPVSGLLFTGSTATPTCRAVGAPRAADLPPPGLARYFSRYLQEFTGAAERPSAAPVPGRALRARGAVTACRLKRSRGRP
jgi:hypothetical protein